MVLIDYYKTLNISFDAQSEDIKVAYRKLAKKFHPDVVGDDEFYASRFKDIKEAYEVLSDPKTRALYNSAHKRFSRTAYAIGNNLVTNGSRDNGALYAWHPAHRKVKQLLSKKQSLFLGLCIVFISVVSASVFFGLQRNTNPAVYSDVGYEVPVAHTAVPMHPPPQPVIKKRRIVVSGSADSAPVATIPNKAGTVTIPSPIHPAVISKIVVAPIQPVALPAIASLPVLPLLNLPRVTAGGSSTSAEGIASAEATHYGYVVFTIRRNVQRTGIGNDTYVLNYVSGVSSYNALSQEDVARVMLDADIECSAAQSNFAKGFSGTIQTVTYNIESRRMKPFATAQAAIEAMRREPKSNRPENSIPVQFGYLVFQVKREIYHPSGKTMEMQSITYSTDTAPYGNLSAQQRADIIVKGEASASQLESRYAATHSRKDDKISYRITGRNFKTYKTQTQADNSHKSEPPSVSLR